MQKFLKKNSKTFLSLLSKIEEGIVIHSKDTSIIYANPSAAKILGLSEDELLGKTATNFDWYFVNEKHERLASNQYPVNIIFQSNQNISNMRLGVHISQNEFRWIDLSGSITTIEENEPIALIIFSDVTETKNAFDEAELFKELVEIADTGITFSNPNLPDNPLVYANKAFTKITGYSLQESLGINCRYLQKDDTKQEEISLIKKAIDEQTSCEVILRNYTKDGELFYNLLNIAPFFQRDKLQYFIGIQHDITTQILQEQKLTEQTLYIQSILDAQENIVLVSDGIQATYSNKALLDFFSLKSFEEFVQKYSCICHTFLNDNNYFHLGKVKPQQHWVEALLSIPHKKRVVAIQHKENNIKYFEVNIKPIANSLYVITLNDITLNLLKQLLLKDKAYHDALTGLYNRQYFYEYILNASLQKSTITGIIIADIDNFKVINDTFGHDTGDEVLKALAKNLQKTLRQSDYLIRWGGEEFVIVCETESKDKIVIIAENLRKTVENIMVEKVGHFTASFGVTNLLENENIDSAIGRADKALYEAKSTGKNKVKSC